MNEKTNLTRSVNRRSFLKTGLAAAGANAAAALLVDGTKALAQTTGSLTAGDAAILRFLAAAELIEADLWTQYAELGGIGNNRIGRYKLEGADPNFVQYEKRWGRLT